MPERTWVTRIHPVVVAGSVAVVSAMLSSPP
jgi:hypothetical protein